MLPDPEHSFVARALLVAGYAFAAWCWSRAARRARSDYDSYWWRVGTVGLLLLATNKLLNLRLVFPLIGILIVSILATKSRAFLKKRIAASMGWMLLLLYLVLRQTQEWKPSLVVLNAIRYHDWRLVLEVAGIVMVVVGASWAIEPLTSRKTVANSSTARETT